MSKAKKVTYWVATVWLSLGMVSTAIAQLTQQKEGPGSINDMIKLGYPVYFVFLIAVWKVLGAVAILSPRLPLLKEWAYAGFFFAMSGAVISHLAVDDPAIELFPAGLLLALTGISWFARPVDRKWVASNQ